MRFWNTYNGHSVVGGGGEDRWWSVEELGEGASLVRSKTDGREKEVWVLRMGDDRMSLSFCPPARLSSHAVGGFADW